MTFRTIKGDYRHIPPTAIRGVEMDKTSAPPAPYVDFGSVEGIVDNGGTYVTQDIVKNDIVNGTFDLWRYSISSTGVGYVSADRWRWYYFGGGAVTSQRVTFAAGQTSVPGGPLFQARAIVTDTGDANSQAILAQRCNTLRKWSGKRVQVRFYARVQTGTASIAVEGRQNFGSGGSTTVDVGTTVHEVGESWTLVETYIDFPSIEGKTLGTDEYSHLIFWMSSGTDNDVRSGGIGTQNNTFDFAEVEAYVSDVKRPVYRPTKEETISACDHFAQVFLIVVGTDMANAARQKQWHFKQMRKTPAVTYTSGLGGSVVVLNNRCFRADGNATGFGTATVWCDSEL